MIKRYKPFCCPDCDHLGEPNLADMGEYEDGAYIIYWEYKDLKEKYKKLQDEVKELNDLKRSYERILKIISGE